MIFKAIETDGSKVARHVRVLDNNVRLISSTGK